MKNKGLIILICSVIIVLIVSIMFVYNLKTMDSNLFGKTWYHYDYKTGYFDKIYLDNNDFSYYKPNNDNATNEFSFCSRYSYNKLNKKFKLDCGKELNIKSVNEKFLKINLDNKQLVFYNDINDSINYEFKKYFDLNIEEYKNKNKHTLDIIKINESEIINILNSEEYSKIIFIGNKCTSISCTLINDVIEKWISFSKNVYYINSSNIDKNILKILNKIDDKFSLNGNYYNSINPVIYVISNNKVVDLYNIECVGFNCSNYYNK